MPYNFLSEEGYIPATSDNIDNKSTVPGNSVTDALDGLAIAASPFPNIVLNLGTAVIEAPFSPSLRGTYANLITAFFGTVPADSPGDSFPASPGNRIDVAADSLEPGATLVIRNPNGIPPDSGFQLTNIVVGPNPDDPGLTRFTFDVTGTFGPVDELVASYVAVTNPTSGKATFAGWLISGLSSAS